MKRRDLDYVVIVLLVGSSLYVFVTGLIADTMGLHHFGLHSQVGYLWMFLAVAHLIQTWVRVRAFVRNRFRDLALTPRRPGILTHSTGDAISAPPEPSTAFSSTRSPTLQSSTDSTSAKGPSKGEQAGRRYLLLAILAIATGIGFDRLITPRDEINGPEGERDIGLLYHKWSQPGYSEAIDTLLNWGKQPPRYKTYPDAPQIDLPTPDFIPPGSDSKISSAPTLDLVTAITTRRSRRNYNTQSILPLAHLSKLLYLAQGITWDNREFRAVPSSGALYPLEIYPIVHRVGGLEPGLYHHAIQHHKLELVKSGDLRQPLITAGLSQDFLGEANVCFVVSGIFQRTRWKYHERTYRYVLMEVGHLGQNLYLAATALGLGVCCIGAFFDDPINQLLQIDGEEEAALYLITVGML
ncbi:MAG: SagB/ThcOx family dehydrogenase [Leptolyngbyaceae cyanobacterium MO_188.B28]|nr:SagB/ThcOx family dehydrogenase [Leptolyngbyaceae cyanobacterium MO_188.B28]